MKRSEALSDARRRAARCVVLVASLVALANCRGDDAEARAVRAAKAFVSAVRTSDTKALVTLLEADAVAQLEGSALRDLFTGQSHVRRPPSSRG